MKSATLAIAIIALLTTLGFGVYHLFRNKKNQGKFIVYKQ